MGAYDSSYTVYTDPSQWSGLGSPMFTATMRLADNSAGSTGLSELILNGASGQLAWGVDSNGDVNSDSNYPSPNYVQFELDIPQSSSPVQSPATLEVGSASAIQYSGASSYNSISNVLVVAQVILSGTPAGCVLVAISGLSITFQDASGNSTTNPTSGTNPIASQGTTCTPGQGKTQALLATPAPSPGFVPVRVTISGSVRLISTDSTFKNYGAGLSATSMQAKILVWTA